MGYGAQVVIPLGHMRAFLPLENSILLREWMSRSLDSQSLFYFGHLCGGILVTAQVLIME